MNFWKQVWQDARWTTYGSLLAVGMSLLGLEAVILGNLGRGLALAFVAHLILWFLIARYVWFSWRRPIR